MICEPVVSTGGGTIQNQGRTIWTNSEEPESCAKTKNDSGPLNIKSRSAEVIFSPEDFIWLELSRVADVECVFVEKDAECRSFSVLTFVKNYTEEVRLSIYRREKCIIRAHPGCDFDFHITGLMNRSLEEILASSPQKPYRRLAPAA